MPERLLKVGSVMQDPVVREIKTQSKALGFLRALPKTGCREEATRSSSKPASLGHRSRLCRALKHFSVQAALPGWVR